MLKLELISLTLDGSFVSLAIDYHFEVHDWKVTLVALIFILFYQYQKDRNIIWSCTKILINQIYMNKMTKCTLNKSITVYLSDSQL